ncbi:hypothetical protein, partial [Acinetobacter baumannii]|uniref:hypothetical protein n=1 Tax=Acinetobacter baumannii TaxID=470 RepID=UPI003C75664E
RGAGGQPAHGDRTDLWFPPLLLRIQIEQLLIIVIAFIALPYFGVTYEIALLTFSFLTFARYLFILLKMNQRAK